MSARLLFDTDVLVDYLRGRPEAGAFLEAHTEGLLASSLAAADLFAGAREGNERVPC